jgi:hypothetical protein
LVYKINYYKALPRCCLPNTGDIFLGIKTNVLLNMKLKIEDTIIPFDRINSAGIQYCSELPIIPMRAALFSIIEILIDNNLDNNLDNNWIEIVNIIPNADIRDYINTITYTHNRFTFKYGDKIRIV